MKSRAALKQAASSRRPKLLFGFLVVLLESFSRNFKEGGIMKIKSNVKAGNTNWGA